MSSGTITAITGAKYTGYVGAFLVFEFLDIPQMQICVLGVLMVLDFVTGIGKQFRINKKDITSHRAWLGAMKKVGSFIVIFSLALVLKAMELDADGYIKGVISIFIMAEFYSIVQNIYTLRTGTVIPEFDAISLVLKMIGDFIKTRIEKALDPNNNKNEKTQDNK